MRRYKSTKANFIYKYKNKAKPILLAVSGLLFNGTLSAQDSMNASGGDASSASGSGSYSVGQMVYKTYSSSAGSGAEGVQYAYEIFTVGIANLDSRISLSVYPNPTRDHLALQVSDYNNEEYYYQVLGMQGEQVAVGKIVSKQTFIAMEHLASSTYFLNITSQDKKNLESFKIVKN